MNDPTVSPGMQFPHMETWIFDLDNTLYPPSMNLFAQVDRRMTDFVADYLCLSRDEARTLQKRLFHEHGTTLAGLMRDHAMDPHAFLEYVHDIDVEVLTPDPELADILARLPGRRLIYTNGSVAHALRVTERLGISHLFDGIHDIIGANYTPKPSLAAFEDFLARFAILPERAVFFDDMPHNLEPAYRLGLTTVWVDQPSEWSRPGGEGPHIHHRTPSVKQFASAKFLAKDSP